MTPRDTTTGWVLEQMILPALSRGQYTYEKQVCIGERLGGGRHKIDVLARDASGIGYLISCKWQEVSGTAEQKVPYEVLCLTEAIMAAHRSGHETFQEGYIVLGGPGWRLRDFYVGGGLQKYLVYPDIVSIVTLEEFIRLANQGRL